MFLGLVRSMRPHQWVKNFFVLAPLVFAGKLFEVRSVVNALIGFGAFCLLTSAVYLFNDIVDLEADRAHPVKCKRPIASGRVSVSAARAAAVGLLIAALVIAFYVGFTFLAIAVSYLVQNVVYSFWLKRVAYVDVISIALGFELRVLAGSFAANVSPSAYLLIVMFLLATFLGFGKRMHELGMSGGDHKQRKVLKAYSRALVKRLLVVTGSLTVLVYLVYTLDPATRRMFGTDYLAITTVFTAFGVFRFLRLVAETPSGDSPTDEMLRDKPFIANLACWALAVVGIIYLSSGRPIALA